MALFQCLDGYVERKANSLLIRWLVDKCYELATKNIQVLLVSGVWCHVFRLNLPKSRYDFRLLIDALQIP